MNITTIDNDITQARKISDKTRLSVLNFLKNEINKIAKADKNRQPTDDDVITAGNRLVKQTKETMSFIDPSDDRYKTLSNEISIITEYLPKKMGKDELHSLISDILNDESAPEGKAQRGFVMKVLNSQYRGMFDNTEASEYFS